MRVAAADRPGDSHQKDPRRVPPRRAWCVLALTGLSFALLLRAADRPWLGVDGGLSLAVSLQEIPDLLAIWARDTHPPLYYLILHFWSAIAGNGWFAAKFPGLAAALLAVPLAYQTGRRLGSPGLGLLAAYLVAISMSHVARGVSVRDFVLGATLSLACVYTFINALARPQRALPWAAYAACAIAALYTYYFGAPVLAAQGLYLLLAPAYRPLLGRWCTSIAGVAAAYTPWLWLALPPAWENLARPGLLDPGQAGPSPLDPQRGFVVSALTWLTSAAAPGVAPWQVGLVALAVCILAWWCRRRAPVRHRGLLVLGLAVTLAFAHATTELWLKETGVDRYVYIALPFYVLAAGYALHTIGRGRPLALAALLALATAPFLLSYRLYLGTDHSTSTALRDYLASRAGPDDLLLFTFPGQAGDFASLTRDQWRWRLIPTSGFRSSVVDDVDQRALGVLQEAAEHRALWLILWDGDPGNRPVYNALARAAYHAGSDWVERVHVAAFLPPSPLKREPVSVHFANGVELASAAYDRDAAAGGGLRATLRWRAAQDVAADHRVFVHLVDSRGRRWAQHDGRPQVGQRPTGSWEAGDVVEDPHGILVPAEAPPGLYWLEVGLTGAGRVDVEGGGTVARIGPVLLAPAWPSPRVAETVALGPAGPTTEG